MKAMSSRDCVLAALNRQKPDRIPIDLGGRVSSLSVDVYEALRSELSLPVRPRTIPYDLHYERLGIAEFEEDLLERLKEEFGGKLSFWAGIDTQDLLPFGTPRQVEETVAGVAAGLSRGRAVVPRESEAPAEPDRGTDQSGSAGASPSLKRTPGP